jgi:biopolymer transport protein TolQ
LLQEVPVEPLAAGGLIALVSKTGSFALAILLLLLLFSILSWTIIFRKWMTFRTAERQNRAFKALFHKSERLSEIHSACEHYRGTPLSCLFAAGYHDLNLQLQTLQNRHEETKESTQRPILPTKGFASIQRTLLRAAAAELSLLEKNMSWLATTASVTPFIGLLGTVVGIISAFEGLGLEKTASIQAVAPGIADALIATAAGLFAAIPAVIAFNQFVHRIKNIGQEMDDFSTEFINLVERSFT